MQLMILWLMLFDVKYLKWIFHHTSVWFKNDSLGMYGRSKTVSIGSTLSRNRHLITSLSSCSDKKASLSISKSSYGDSSFLKSTKVPASRFRFFFLCSVASTQSKLWSGKFIIDCSDNGLSLPKINGSVIDLSILGNREKQSAKTFSFPGMYLRSTLYWSMYVLHRRILLIERVLKVKFLWSV